MFFARMVETGIVEFPRDDVEARIRLVLELLPEIGRSLASFQDEVHIENSRSQSMDRTLMEKSDRFVEDTLLPALRDEFGEDPINSEEQGRIDGESDFDWWIDPVDGTRNFIHGNPLYCMSVGLCFRGSPCAGVVHVPAFGETYHAVAGQGAFKNGTPIVVSRVDSVERGLTSAGLPFRRKEFLNDLIADLSAFAATGTGLRRTGSTVLDLCWIAEGRSDALWDRALTPYDTCAASVILLEAGGRISNLEGDIFSFEVPEAVVSNGVLHDQVLEVIQKARRVEGMN